VGLLDSVADAAGDAADAAKDAVDEAAETAQETADEAVDTAQETAEDAAEAVGAEDTVDKIEDEVQKARTEKAMRQGRETNQQQSARLRRTWRARTSFDEARLRKQLGQSRESKNSRDRPIHSPKELEQLKQSGVQPSAASPRYLRTSGAPPR